MEDTRKPARKPRSKVATKAQSPSAPSTVASAPAATPAARSKSTAAASGGPLQRPADRETHIRMAAYLRAERRGFAPGRDWEDWLAAEAEVDAAPAMAAGKPRTAARRTRAAGD